MSYFPILSSPQTLIQFPPKVHRIHPRSDEIRHSNRRRIGASISSSSSNPSNSGNSLFRSQKSRSSGGKNVDIATLGNLCVDIVLNVPQLPPKPLPERKAFMEQLSSSTPDKRCWEAGGQCNTAIAASRLGLECAAIGQVGNDTYGNFLLNVLNDEGIDFVKMSDDSDATMTMKSACQTLLCWVLVDPLQKHGFCSPADFIEEPIYSCIDELTTDVKLAIKQSKILVVNGFGFDDFSPVLMVSALKYAVEHGTCIFFDPGTRGRSLSTGTPQEQMAQSEYLKMSNIVLLTSDEAESLTGIKDPISAGQDLLKRGLPTKWVIIKNGSKGSILITSSGICCVPSFKVKVNDTVGCGDSYVAAVAFGFVNKMPMIHTLTIANAVGASTATGHGAGRNVATFEKTTELIKAGDLNEDDEFWRELLYEIAETQKVTLLSNKAIIGIDPRLSFVPLSRVIPELTSKLESAN